MASAETLSFVGGLRGDRNTSMRKEEVVSYPFHTNIISSERETNFPRQCGVGIGFATEEDWGPPTLTPRYSHDIQLQRI